MGRSPRYHTYIPNNPSMQTDAHDPKLARSLTYIEYISHFFNRYLYPQKVHAGGISNSQLLRAISQPISSSSLPTVHPINKRRINTHKSAKVISPRILAFNSNSTSKFSSILNRNPSSFFPTSPLSPCPSPLAFRCCAGLGRWGRECYP